MTRLSGVIPMLVTPFAANGAVELAEVAALTRFCLEEGVQAVAVGGLASESAALTLDEREAVAATVLASAAGAPVVVGCTTAETAASLRLARHAADGGAAAVMVAPAQASTGDVASHFATIAAAIAPVPMMVQDAPAFVGVTLDPDFVGALADQHPNVRYAKPETTPAVDSVARLCRDSRLRVFGGQAGVTMIDLLEAGAHGVIPGCDIPATFAAIDAAWRRGDHAGARAEHERVLPLLAAEFQSLECFIASVKTVLVARGVIGRDTLRGRPDALGPTSRATLLAHAARIGVIRRGG
jgi:4-hydroxy-tetrahydrodipicolinate synthase